MDKKIWLKVIREELGLLDHLATGMIEDAELSKEEVELAISRSNMVTKEFEMLRSHIPEPLHRREIKEEVRIPADAAPPKVDNPAIVIETEDDLLSSIEAERLITHVPSASFPPSPVPDPSETVLASPSVPASEAVLAPPSVPAPEAVLASPSIPSSEAIAPPLPGSVVPSPSAPPSTPEPSKPKSIFPTPPREEPIILNMELKEEEHTIYKQAPIKSLKEGLILNDRYLFQRELFNNDKSRLDETIEALDRLKNIQEAVAYLKANFQWTKSEASEKFVKLVKRRFS